MYLCINNMMKANSKILDSKDYLYVLDLTFIIINLEKQNADIVSLYVDLGISTYVTVINNEPDFFPFFLKKYNLQLTCLFKAYLPSYISIRKYKKVYLQLVEFIIAILRHYENQNDKKTYDEFVYMLINNEIVEENSIINLLNTIDNNTVRYKILEELYHRVFQSEGESMLVDI